jgi:hypothetical protein
MIHKPQVPTPAVDGMLDPTFQSINRNYNETAHFGNDLRLNIQYIHPDAP